MPLVTTVYTSIGGGNVILRAIVAAFCLLPPTLMMGATLPAVARFVETSPRGVAWLGFFYGGNIGGAVLGSLLAGFYLLRVHDMAIATYAAVALNVLVGALGLFIASRAPYQAAEAVATGEVEKADGANVVYVAIAISGMTALASQVIWSRLLSLMFGATTYTFSLILAVFLFGLGIGSSLGASIARSSPRPRVALGWCQMGLWRHSLGRQLPVGAGGRGQARAGSWPARGRRVRGQHRGRDRRVARRGDCDYAGHRQSDGPADPGRPLRLGGARAALAGGRW
jgi:spermidine synthase